MIKYLSYLLDHVERLNEIKAHLFSRALVRNPFNFRNKEFQKRALICHLLYCCLYGVVCVLSIERTFDRFDKSFNPDYTEQAKGSKIYRVVPVAPSATATSSSIMTNLFMVNISLIRTCLHVLK